MAITPEKKAKYDDFVKENPGVAMGAGVGGLLGSMIPVVGTGVGMLVGGVVGAAIQGAKKK
ncbi:hypothetical protein [Helicobacter felis]|uniref:hypothetical protein n=1 Tax=Helicobacter felis TaxID=214 RepID=UPI000CF046A7|nr:hypothetical protein [Helicobacter felis]